MLQRLLILFLLIIAACEPAAPAALPPTAIPFPTMTPGRTVHGILPTVVALPLDGASLANPATAMALASQPTITPDYSACPSGGSTTLDETPATGREMALEMARFLNLGGTLPALDNALRSVWDVLGDTGSLRNDIDLTGEGVPEIIAAYSAPDDGGTLLVLGCADGQYTPRYQAITGGSAPQIVQIGDMNFDQRLDMLFASENCTEGEDCAYQTQLITWSQERGRFISLLNNTIVNESIPTLSDVDNDRVTEIVVRLENPGDARTGPLRTGVNIYDWNGAAYVLSIIQLDPPRFRIQILHAADRVFAQLDTDQAIPLYELAVNDTSLRFWYNDEPTILNSYGLYRLLLAYAYVEDERRLSTYQTIVQTFPDPAAAPVYTAMSMAFWDALQVTNNLHSACLEVQAIIQARPEALSLLNRYGNRSPTYTAEDLCPF
jgi:hypothetical protein